MKNIKKIASLLVCLVLLACMLPSVRAEENEARVFFHVTLRRNTFFARYTVDVMVDGSRIATLDQGDQVTFSLMLGRGSHTLTLVPNRGGVEKRVWMLGELGNNAVVFCEAQTHCDYISLNEYSVSDGGAEVSGVNEWLPDDTADSVNNAVSVVTPFFN